MNHRPKAASKLPSPLHDLILEVKELIGESDDRGPSPFALLGRRGGEPTRALWMHSISQAPTSWSGG